jgi:hypothetical protein
MNGLIACPRSFYSFQRTNSNWDHKLVGGVISLELPIPWYGIQRCYLVMMRALLWQHLSELDTWVKKHKAARESSDQVKYSA